MKNYILSIFLITLLIGCGTNTILINEKYKSPPSTKKEMIVLPIFYDSLLVYNWDDVVDDFEIDSSNYKSFIYDTLSKSILHNLKYNTQYLKISNGNKFMNWEDIKKDTNSYFVVYQNINEKYKAEFQIPKKEFFNSYPVASSYALIIKKIVIGRNIDRQTGGMIYVPGQTISTPGGSFQTPGSFGSGWTPENLGAITEFIIWDYTNNDFVKCGQIISKVEFLFGMTTGTWISLFKTIPNEIFQDTPYAIPTPNYYKQ